MTIPEGHRLHAVTGSLPATAPGPVVLSLTDETGRVRAEWVIQPGGALRWSDLAGVRTDSDWEEAVSPVGPVPGQPAATAPLVPAQTGSTAVPLEYRLHWV